jgi:CRISPR-associated protein Cas1
MTMIPGRAFHVAGADCVLTRRGGRLVAYRQQRLCASAPLTQISEVVLTGPVTVTTAAMHTLLHHGIPTIMLTSTGRPLGRLEPPTAPHILARQRQTTAAADPARCLAFSRAVIAGKIRNQQVLLRRRARTAADPDTIWAAARSLADLEERATQAPSVASAMGVEGGAAGVYYRAIRTMLDAGLGFTSRDRTRHDPVNALTNYCSALLREMVTSAILAAGLDPYTSLLHTPTRGRPTLAFDLMEEWRPVLLDATVLALIGLRAVTAEDIIHDEGVPLLTAAARAHAISRFHTRLAAPARAWPPLPERRTYHDRLFAQARALRGWLLGDQDTYQPFAWR